LSFGILLEKAVTKEQIDAMNASIQPTVEGKTLTKFYIYSANDGHRCPSRHATGNGIDIYRVNGKHISVHYTKNATINAIIDGLQTNFESAFKRRKNYGPIIKRKKGEDNDIGGHEDHFHWSLNGDHSACSALLAQETGDGVGIYR
tara:strand:+ start:2353 stop:2790 length:438 start_codon:yes stop_codon:yes gene_type:complete